MFICLFQSLRGSKQVEEEKKREKKPNKCLNYLPVEKKSSFLNSKKFFF
jgi:hypothetical protein